VGLAPDPFISTGAGRPPQTGESLAARSAPSRRPSMANNTLVINCDLRETRVALIEDGIIAELHIERAAARGTVGNIVLGRVTRVLPGMQAAFIDVGMERAAFLHVEDLIRPDDFEAYLSGRARDGDADPSGKGEGGRRVFTAARTEDVEFESGPARSQPIAAPAHSAASKGGSPKEGDWS